MSAAENNSPASSPPQPTLSPGSAASPPDDRVLPPDDGTERDNAALQAQLLAGEIDLYCFTCGYNLRGLSGDPKRCPECGNLNPVSDLQITAALITAQLRTLETAPTICFAGLLAFGCGALVLLRELAGLTSERLPCLYWPMFIFGILACPIGAVAFAGSCQRQPGWGRALLRFNVCAALLFGLAFGAPVLMVISGEAALGYLSGSGLPGAVRTCAKILTVPMLLAFVVFCFWLGQRFYALAREGFPQLQRQVAVKLARSALTRQIQRNIGKAR